MWCTTTNDSYLDSAYGLSSTKSNFNDIGRVGWVAMSSMILNGINKACLFFYEIGEDMSQN